MNHINTQNHRKLALTLSVQASDNFNLHFRGQKVYWISWPSLPKCVRLLALPRISKNIICNFLEERFWYISLYDDLCVCQIAWQRQQNIETIESPIRHPQVLALLFLALLQNLSPSAPFV